MSHSSGKSLFAVFLQTPWGYPAALLVCIGLGVSAVKLPSPYSYWLDELWSVAMANLSMAEMYRQLLVDVHPPLYQFLLKIWIALFGDSEFSTRSLSWLCSVAALGVLAHGAKRYGHVFLVTAVVFFATNALFLYYANETRAYGMALLLSTLLVMHYPRRGGDVITWPFLVACLLLSLTHYFGVILSGLAIMASMLQNMRHRGNLLKLLALGFLCLLWPLHHMTAGEIMNRTGGNFWIQVNGFRDTLRIARSGYLGYGPYKALQESIMAIAIAIALVPIVRRRGAAAAPWSDLERLCVVMALVVISFVLLVAAVDHWSPLSTRRNYIVLLPLVSVLVGGLAASLSARSRALTYVILPVVFLSSFTTARSGWWDVSEKALAKQDWKGAAELIVNMSEGRKVYFASRATWWPEMEIHINNHYLRQMRGGEVKADPYVPGATLIQKPALIMFGHSQRIFGDLKNAMGAAKGRQIFDRYDPGLWGREGASVGVFLVED